MNMNKKIVKKQTSSQLKFKVEQIELCHLLSYTQDNNFDGGMKSYFNIQEPSDGTKKFIKKVMISKRKSQSYTIVTMKAFNMNNLQKLLQKHDNSVKVDLNINSKLHKTREENKKNFYNVKEYYFYKQLEDQNTFRKKQEQLNEIKIKVPQIDKLIKTETSATSEEIEEMDNHHMDIEMDYLVEKNYINEIGSIIQQEDIKIQQQSCFQRSNQRNYGYQTGEVFISEFDDEELISASKNQIEEFRQFSDLSTSEDSRLLEEQQLQNRILTSQIKNLSQQLSYSNMKLQQKEKDYFDLKLQYINIKNQHDADMIDHHNLTKEQEDKEEKLIEQNRMQEEQIKQYQQQQLKEGEERKKIQETLKQNQHQFEEFKQQMKSVTSQHTKEISNLQCKMNTVESKLQLSKQKNQQSRDDNKILEEINTKLQEQLEEVSHEQKSQISNIIFDILFAVAHGKYQDEDEIIPRIIGSFKNEGVQKVGEMIDSFINHKIKDDNVGTTNDNNDEDDDDDDNDCDESNTI